MSKHEKTEWTIIVGSHTLCEDNPAKRQRTKDSGTQTKWKVNKERTPVYVSTLKYVPKKNKETQTDPPDEFWKNFAIQLSFTVVFIFIYSKATR